MLSSARRLVIVFILVIGPRAYACNSPDPVSVPAGNTAAESEMMATDSAIKQYILELQRYADCIEPETGVLRGSASRGDSTGAKQREERAIELQNEAAATIEEVSERFNKAIAEYKTPAR